MVVRGFVRRKAQMVTRRWLSELPPETRREVIRRARRKVLHPDQLIAKESVEWAIQMRPGGQGYMALSWVVVAFETALAFVGFGTLGEESAASERIAAKRILRIPEH